MKVYERNENKFQYPEDMAKILNYLNGRGKILVKESKIEDLYHEFSDKKYCAGWMSVDMKLLQKFEEWLREYEL